MVQRMMLLPNIPPPHKCSVGLGGMARRDPPLTPDQPPFRRLSARRACKRGQPPSTCARKRCNSVKPWLEFGQDHIPRILFFDQNSCALRHGRSPISIAKHPADRVSELHAYDPTSIKIRSYALDLPRNENAALV